MEDAIAGLLAIEEAIAREEKRNDVLSEKVRNVVKEEKTEEKQLLYETGTEVRHREGDHMCHQVPSVWMEHEDVKKDAKRIETDSRDCFQLVSGKISECMNKLIVESTLEAPNILSRRAHAKAAKPLNDNRKKFGIRKPAGGVCTFVRKGIVFLEHELTTGGWTASSAQILAALEKQRPDGMEAEGVNPSTLKSAASGSPR
ncbi:hypothetical protein HPB48_003061 [Haemaphysalis longicornis]|uniref:Uncharacterized protein n=1 Tax=Haemaphysalis longicornis TaxID=44386 RepID=A0A9J6FSB1_HAELO|nr:hypothetical protein HPB48_003061 [Haemaphysalis longicornis]